MSRIASSVWSRIIQAQGPTFAQKRGKRFTYRVSEDGLFPSTTRWRIPREHVERAIERMPAARPGELNDLFGPSYLWGILMDPRIRRDDW